MKSSFALMLICLFIVGSFTPRASAASSGKEFTTSVIYGTLAGTLVGAATLAFTSNPGDNLGNVARGASYGLYAGILLGLYVTYGLSDPEPPRDDQGPASGPDAPQGSKKSEMILNVVELEPKSLIRSGFSIYPIMSSQNSRDVGVGVTLLSMTF